MPKLLQYLQEKVVFLPASLKPDHTFTFKLNFKEYFWDTPFEGKINALHFNINEPKGVLLYFHGNSDNLQRWGEIASEFTRFGYDVIVMDYRGYGKSTGLRNEEFLYADAQFAYDYAKKHYGEENTLVYGRSLGGAFATKVGGNNQPRAVILESVFYNLEDVVNRWLPGKVTSKVAPTMTYLFLSNENILTMSAPLFQFHGTADKVVPLSSGRKLFNVYEQARPAIQKKFIEINDGTHDNLVIYPSFSEEMSEILS